MDNKNAVKEHIWKRQCIVLTNKACVFVLRPADRAQRRREGGNRSFYSAKGRQIGQCKAIA